MTPRLRLAVALLSLAFFAAHARALPDTLDDIDSINFALGVDSFDVGSHQPHPPGYPVFIAIAKASTGALDRVAPGWDRDRRAAVGLSVWGLIAGTLAVTVLVDLWIVLGLPPVLALLAALLAVASPLFWFTAARPLTDTPGLVAALAVQAGLLRGWQRWRESSGALPRVWVWSAAAAGLIIGLRSQTMWLTGPLLAACAGRLAVDGRWRQALGFVAAGAAGVVAWFVPLVWLTGGPGAYVDILGSQGAMDFEGVAMLALAPGWEAFGAALRQTFTEPWQARVLANVVVGLAVLGLARLAWRAPRMLGLLALAFGPYLAFHLLFHETERLRYGLPLVVPVAGLAVAAAGALGTRAAAAAIGAASVASLLIAQPRLEAFASEGGTIFRAFQDMQREHATEGVRPLLRMHHQVWWGVRRATDWYRPIWDVGPQPFPGDREWRDLVEYWADGGTTPVWYLTDVARRDVALFDPRARTLGGRYELRADIRRLEGGAWLDSLVWWRLAPPGWMLGDGWSLNPEVAGMTEQDALGPHRQPAEAWVRRQPGPVRVLIGGRYLGRDGEPPARVSLEVDGRTVSAWLAAADPAWFVHWIDVDVQGADGGGPYARLTVHAGSDEPGRSAPAVGLEQFDAAPGDTVMFAFGGGWHEPELNPATGAEWRWTRERGTIDVRGPARDLELRLAGESPLRYFDRAPVVVVRAGEREVARFEPATDFDRSFTVPAADVQAAGGRITIETDLTFVPGEREATPDRRRLGLRLFAVEVQAR